MKKYKLKQSVKEFLEILIASAGIAIFAFTMLSCISWRVKECDKSMLEQQKKTEMSGTQISQNKN